MLLLFRSIIHNHPFRKLLGMSDKKYQIESIKTTTILLLLRSSGSHTIKIERPRILKVIAPAQPDS
ncbi:MAG: hypothetical protein JNL53_11310 [Cyclobacteriaceae bacterium]|nr:hypothetical protein [Cyclobacteriaceae bacterium]